MNVSNGMDKLGEVSWPFHIRWCSDLKSDQHEVRTKILSQIFTFESLSLVRKYKRYLHKWGQNGVFLPAPPAKQAKCRNSLTSCYLLSPVYQVLSHLPLCLCG